MDFKKSSTTGEKNIGEISENSYDDQQDLVRFNNILKNFQRNSRGIVRECKDRQECKKPSVKRKLKSENARRRKNSKRGRF